MRPHIGAVTLGVKDLAVSLRFYRNGLGWKSGRIIGADLDRGAPALFELEDGISFAVFPRANLAKHFKVEQRPLSSTELSLAHNVSSRAQVDRLLRRAWDAGAEIVEPAERKAWGGYSGYFQDPDGHLWEILYTAGF